LVVQRRSIRAKIDIFKNSKIKRKMIDFLRPRPQNSIDPYNYKKLINKKISRNIQKGDVITWRDIK
jgi:sialic acid synthase SpsE